MIDKQFTTTYIQSIASGEIKKAFLQKNKMIPDSLFRYEKFSPKRLVTLKRGKIFLSTPDKFNDIYDSVGIYYTEVFEQSILDRFGIEFASFKAMFDNLLNTYYKLSGITCFTEDRDNFPMWWSYAGNHSGICIEYDIADVSLNHSKSCDEIFPVIYCDEKVNFDNLLIRLTDNIEKGEPQVLPEMMLFHVLRGTLKHRSWSYEAEWRCIRVGAYGEADFVPKIKSVYLGSKFDKANISDIEDIARERDFNVYQLSSTSFTQQRYSFNSTPVFEHNTVEI